MRVIFLPRAAQHLNEIGAYIAAHNPGASDRIVQRILDHCSNLKHHPLIGRPGLVAETRELIVPGTNFIVPYRVRAGAVEILGVFHAAQDWKEKM